MTIREQLFRFPGLDTHSAILVQKSIENRKENITIPDSELMKKGDKVIKAVVDELDQMFDDLDRHIAEQVRQQEKEQERK
jgi:hypothetical protein